MEGTVTQFSYRYALILQLSISTILLVLENGMVGRLTQGLKIPAGMNVTLRGIAFSGFGGVNRVEVSDNGGKSWMKESDSVIRIISARKATKKEFIFYEEGI